MEMIRKMNRFFIKLVIWLCTSSLADIYAQTTDLQNVANWRHPWVSATNPATIPWQPARISLGLKAFQMGFLPDQSLGLHESRINGSLPCFLPFDLGVGIDLKYYTAGAYSEMAGGFLLARRLFNTLALGAKVGFVQIGFSRDNFNLVNPADPLLARSLSKTSFDWGLGLQWNPGKLALGAGFEHLNQPDVGIEHGVRLPMAIYGAVGYQLGPVTPAFLFRHDGQLARYGMDLALTAPRLGSLHLAYQTEMPFKMEVQFNLNPNHQLHYGIDLPHGEISAVSLGSHELAYTYVMGNGPEIGQPELIISSNELKIREETIVRSLPGDILPTDLANSGEVIPEFLRPEGRLNNVLVITAGALSDSESTTLRTERYVTLAKEIRNWVHQHPDLKIVIRTNQSTVKDARTIKHFLETKKIVVGERIKLAEFPDSGALDFTGFHSGKEITTRKGPNLSEEKLVIRLVVPGKTRKLSGWTISILNEKNRSIRLFTGKNKLPEELTWDWRDAAGKLIEPGRYKCKLVVQTESGPPKHAISPILKVTYLKRTVTLKFQHQPKMLISTN
jgi:hypothetical protein